MKIGVKLLDAIQEEYFYNKDYENKVQVDLDQNMHREGCKFMPRSIISNLLFCLRLILFHSSR